MKTSRVLKLNTANQRIQYVLFIVNSLLLHLYTYDFIGDDIITTGYLTPTLSSQFSHLLDGTIGWSSRILINPLIYIMLHFDYHVWILCNVIILFIIYRSLAYLLNADAYPYNLLWMFIMLLYPLDASVNYGMVVMSMTYLWPAAAGCISLFFIKKYMTGNRISVFEWVLLPIFNLYASNKEELSVTLTIIFGAFLLYTVKEHRVSILAGIQFCISLFSVLFHFFSTSNHTRFDILSEHIPYTFFDKIEIGITSTFFYLFCRFDFITILFFGSLCIAVWKKTKSVIIRLLPVLLLALWMIMSLLLYHRSKSINDTDFAISHGKYNSPREILLAVIYFTASILIVSSLYYASNNVREFINYAILLLAGFVGRCVVGFGNKGWMVSFERTYTFLYIILMVLIYLLLKPYIQVDIHKHPKRILWIGILLTILSDLRIIIYLMWL